MTSDNVIRKLKISWKVSPFLKSNMGWSVFFQSFDEMGPFLFQKAPYRYNLAKKIGSNKYLLSFGTQGLLKIQCLIDSA